MFRPMRRTGQALSQEACREILITGSTGILAVHGDNGYPYAVPLSYVYIEGCLYFHCAKNGHKLDSILKEEKVSFCVVANDRTVPSLFAVDYVSAIVFGRACVVEKDGLRRRVLEALNAKYAPGLAAEGEREIKEGWQRVCVVCIQIEHMTGKRAIESVTKANG